ncbi:MAG: UDP-N-acetylglucosamine diphosphorylase [Planctomycetota bacterium]
MNRPSDYFDLSKTEFADLFDGCESVWQAIPKIEAYIRRRLKPGIDGTVMGGATLEGDVYVGKGTVVETGAYVRGPVWIGKNCQIRRGAYLRGAVLVGDGSVLGNACEFKNVAFLGEGTVPHLAYVGDSILGHRAHLGAGVKVSNVKLVRGNVRVEIGNERIDTGLRKFGAIVGDLSEVGCNAVLNPGTMLGPRCMLYPGVSFRGVLAPGRVVKLRQTWTVVERAAGSAPKE